MHPSGPVEGAGIDQSPSYDSTEKLSSTAVNRILMEFLIYFGRALVVFYPVYLTGYLGLSISWVVLFIVMITWWKKNRQWKDVRIGSAIEFVANEPNVISEELTKTLAMATWVHFPDVEKVEWLNKVLRQAWPFFGMFMEKLLKGNIQQSIRLSNSALKAFTFTKVHFGHIPLKITGLKAYTHELDRREVILDLDISYESDVDIDAEVKPAITAGIKGLKLHGMLRVILEPLIGQAPFVGGVTFFFMRCPTLKINWTGLTNILDSPAFSQLSEGTILDIIASLMVLPNRMCIPLIDQVKVDEMRFPLPRGVLRVHLLEARDLVAMDTYMLGLVKGKSDPYTLVRVGNKQFKSKTIKENLHPRWNEVYEFVVHEAPGQQLEIEIFDEDTDKDDFIGRYILDVGEVKKEKEMDKWFPLEGVAHGEIHMKLQWLSLQTDQSLLIEPHGGGTLVSLLTMTDYQDIQNFVTKHFLVVLATTNGCACAMLAVYLDSASNLPKDQSEFSNPQKHGKPLKETKLTRRVAYPNSFVEFSINEQIQKSKIAYASKDPTWEQGFTFFVHSVKNQMLSVQVKENDKKSLGAFSLPLSRLLNVSNMCLDQRFMLERSGTNSQIKMKVTLRILNLEKPKPVPNPPPQPKAQAQKTNQGTISSAPTSAPTSATSHTTSAQVPPPASHSTNGFNEEYEPYRRGSFLVSEGQRTAPATPRMRRFDSHSLLSDNSIASSMFDVSDGAPFPEAIMNHQGSFGEIQLSLRYATLSKKLMVVVNTCRNLFPCNENGSDSFVRLYLLPDQSWRHRKKTQVKKKNLNPSFNEKFEFNVSLEEAVTRKLDLAVKNSRMFHTRERKEIGMALIDLSQVDLVNGSTEWYELTLPGLKKSR